jgi:dienelactone hydrolase
MGGQAMRSVNLGGTGLLLALCVAGCGGGSSGSAQLNLSPTAPPPPAGTTGVPYEAFTFLAPTGGVGPFTWTESGAMPKGMSLATNGLLSGTPTTAGTFPITLTVTDSSSPHLTAKESITLTVNDSPLLIATTPAPPAGAQGSPYPGFTFTATGGSQPISWSVVSGALPAGLSLSAAGLLSGTPTGNTSSTFTVKARDSAPSPEVATQAFTITISAAESITITYQGASTTFQVIPAGTSAKFVGSITHDQNNGGISWSLSCSTACPATCTAATCGSVSPAMTANNSTVTFTAPTVPPPGDNFQMLLLATSQSSPSVSASVLISIPAITVSVVPAGALVPLGISQPVTATVAYDTANKGVTWALAQDAANCAPTCGTVTQAATASGAATRYVPPAALPANPIASLIATSVTEATSSGSSLLTVTNGVVSLIPDDLSFVGSQQNKNFVIPLQKTILTNTGGSALAISGMTISGTNAGDFTQTNNCGASLAAGASCTITAGYTSSVTGVHTATVNIADSSPDSPQQLALTGTNKGHAATGAVVAALRGQSAAFVPAPTGSGQVGTRVVHFIDSGRADPYLGTGARRELLVRLWYPSAASRCAPAEYSSAGVLSELSRLLATPVPHIVTNSCLNAPVAAGSHPVVFVTPGFTGTFTDYTFLAEDLASRGYVVASVDHTYEAVAVEFPDGRVEKGVFGSSLTNYTRSDPDALKFAVAVRVADLRFVADRLTAMNSGGDAAWAGKLDLSRMALLGHSLGGLTAIRAVAADARFRAAISLDGLVPDRLTAPTRTPALLFRTGNRPWNDNDCQLWNALQAERTTVDLAGAEHTALSDLVWLAPGAAATGPMGIDSTVAAVRTFSAEFLNQVFTGTTADATANRSRISNPQTIVTRGEQTRCAHPR